MAAAPAGIALPMAAAVRSTIAPGLAHPTLRPALHAQLVISSPRDERRAGTAIRGPVLDLSNDRC